MKQKIWLYTGLAVLLALMAAALFIPFKSPVTIRIDLPPPSTDKAH
ncbi:hypothetical protein [Asticcacaulis sp. YBE204]|nr:hypothetical protein [Asticcacaulis sp. YBE204]ESQ77975.1 hypothetical protein AEYBE204_15885 [Asticcacaulis sp. YBE204]